eukprot:GEZU01017062.1.p1 GENE.GEZU01017062.1~~GEZU01017062.1.p1  ORF type:complete len:278 (+),score=112.20 GEZU01017062.1:981-1814(+)
MSAERAVEQLADSLVIKGTKMKLLWAKPKEKQAESAASSAAEEITPSVFNLLPPPTDDNNSGPMYESQMPMMGSSRLGKTQQQQPRRTQQRPTGAEASDAQPQEEATAAAAAAPNAAVAPHSSSSSVHSDALFFPSEKSLEKFVALLASAKKSMDICVFTITYDKIANTLIKAHKNGVKIRVITDNDKAADVGSDIGRMAAAGIPTVTDHTSFHMHNKFVIIDHQILINGSFNWTRSASDSNNENVIISDDPVLIRKFDAEFERLWKLFHNEEQASS